MLQAGVGVNFNLMCICSSAINMYERKIVRKFQIAADGYKDDNNAGGW